MNSDSSDEKYNELIAEFKRMQKALASKIAVWLPKGMTGAM